MQIISYNWKLLLFIAARQEWLWFLLIWVTQKKTLFVNYDKLNKRGFSETPKNGFQRGEVNRSQFVVTVVWEIEVHWVLEH